MQKWMNQPHYHKHGWVKYDEAQNEIDRLMDENSLLASWQCLYTDGKQGIVCDDRGSQYCAKQDEIDKRDELLLAIKGAFESDDYAITGALLEDVPLKKGE